jgi:hypothetical protein
MLLAGGCFVSQKLFAKRFSNSWKDEVPGVDLGRISSTPGCGSVGGGVIL